MSALVSSLLTAAVIAVVFYFRFRKQRRTIDNAIAQINNFLAGDADARIESDGEGGLPKLFHAVNTLATTLNAHALREQNTKIFLRDTISDISHQLKTPLSALTVYHSLLRDECGDKDAVREFAAKAARETERIETLVLSLLKITRLDAGVIVMDKKENSVSEIASDVKAYFETRAEREGKEIVLSGSPDVTLVCDGGWLTEAVSNIVKNALDHTEAGGRVSISWDRRPSVTQIVIKDNGGGIHPEDIHHIFKRFYRSRFGEKTQGTGLGLPLAKAIAEAHDGNITADSVLGGGSTFTLSFLNLGTLTKL